MKRAARALRQVAPLPLRAVYTLCELATASSLNRRQLRRLFARIGIRADRAWQACPHSSLKTSEANATAGLGERRDGRDAQGTVPAGGAKRR